MFRSLPTERLNSLFHPNMLISSLSNYDPTLAINTFFPSTFGVMVVPTREESLLFSWLKKIAYGIRPLCIAHHQKLIHRPLL